MDWTQIPIVQGGAVAVLFAVVWLVVRGLLVPRSTLEDVRADRDARVAEAEKDAERAWALYVKERDSHDTTRRALVDQALGAAMPALAVAETGVKILTELQDSDAHA